MGEFVEDALGEGLHGDVVGGVGVGAEDDFDAGVEGDVVESVPLVLPSCGEPVAGQFVEFPGDVVLGGALCGHFEDGQTVVEIVVQFGGGGEHASGMGQGGDAGVGDDAEEGGLPEVEETFDVHAAFFGGPGVVAHGGDVVESGDDVVEAVEVVCDEAAVGVIPVHIDFGANEDAALGFAGVDFGADFVDDGSVVGFEDVVGDGDESEVEGVGACADGFNGHAGGMAAVDGVNVQVVVNRFHWGVLQAKG